MPNLSPEETFTSMKMRVEEAIRRQFPFEGGLRRLELVSLVFDEKAEELTDRDHVDNIAAQFAARTGGRTWGVPIRAHLRLVEKATGTVVDEKTMVLARLPKLTRRYSYIVGGQERQHDSLFRSRPRPYHRIASNDEIQARWNLARGRGFDLKYDPEKGRIHMRVGTTNIPLYSVLHVLDVSDAAMQRSWGQVVYEENVKASKPTSDLAKLYKALALHPPGAQKAPAAEVQAQAVRTYFDQDTEVWPAAMKSAFGKEYSNVNGENLLLSSRRLLDIQNGRTKDDPKPSELPDDRQSLTEKYLVTTEDFIVEAIDQKTHELRRKVRDRIDRPDVGIDNVLGGNVYSTVVKSVFDYSQRPDQTNPLQFVSGYMRTTIRGKAYGGVGSDKVNLDMDKQINPTHLGFLDPIQTPESEDTGIALHLPLGIKIERAIASGGKSRTSTGQELKTRVFDLKTKSWVFATPGDLEYANVAYPDQVTWRGEDTPVPVGDEVVCYASDRRTALRPWSQVRYVLPSSKALFSFSANLVPFMQNNSGGRVMMAAKQQEQAVSLADREAPLVQVKTDGASTFEAVMGSFSAHRAPVAGEVTKITPDQIHINTGGGKVTRVPVYNNYPLNGGKGVMHAEPVVRVGQTVRKGQLLADTNFTRGGDLALGANLRVAYLPWKGLNFEDGIVVSESASVKMSSAHMHQPSVTIYPGMRGGNPGDKALWVDYAMPERTTPDKLKKLDSSGVVLEGTVVGSGDILVAVLSPSQATKEDAILSRISRSLVYAYKDRALVWDHDYEGTVVKVIRSPGLQQQSITVHIRTREPLAVGDKLTGRHGNKGIVSRIVPDAQMPRDKDGDPVHVLLNPAGVPSRMNVGQVLETAASKIAKKTGKPYVIENFVPGVDYSAKVKADLKKHGLSDTEELFDAETGRSVGPVMVGDQYMLKLHHVVEKKMTARSFGHGYTSMGDAPSGSGIPGGGQKMDMLATYAMLAHGANHNLREAYTFKSDGEQDEVWDAVMTGRPLPPPRPTRGMQTFLAYLRAMGINTEKKGDNYVLMPLTDAQVTGKKGLGGISNGAIPLPERALYAKGARTLEEVKGLFDPKITGGMDGPYWSHIVLAERMPNPVFEPAIQAILGITRKEYEGLVGPKLGAGGVSGFKEIVQRLEAVDVAAELAKEKKALPGLQASKLNLAYKRVRYLEALQKLGVSPVDAYTNRVLPVVPPKMRKVSIGLDGTQVLDDLNGLYVSVGQANSALKRADPATPVEDLEEDRAHLYEAIKGLRMTGMSLGRGVGQRHHTGLMEKLTGKVQGSGAPKYSLFQRGVLSRRQDLSGRSTIVPEPAMGLDEVGLPIPVALEMYRPFVVRELFREGTTPLRADRLVSQKDPRALRALEQAVRDRPVLMKRDPALHKFSIMAFKPRLIEGKAIKIHPLVTGGFNADFDGDTMALYVPVSEAAVDEARGMTPSRNLFSPTHYGLMPVPEQDSLLGLYQSTGWGKKVSVPATATAAVVVQMLKDGKLKSTDVVRVGGKETTPGRLLLAQSLPPEMREDERLLHDRTFRLNKRTLKSFLAEVGRKAPKHFPLTVDAWKDHGNEMSFLNGSSFSINDFHDGKAFRDYFLKGYREEEAAIRASSKPRKVKDREIVEVYQRARKKLREHGEARYNARSDNRVWEWAESGARGGWNQFSQLVFGPMLVQDPEKKHVPVPITASYGEGLPLAQYWASMHGARKGTLDRAAGTREPGALTKDIINTAINTRISGSDCGTTQGAPMSPADHDAVDRYLARRFVLQDGTGFDPGTLLTTAILSRAQGSNIQQVMVRSPLHCKMRTGICATCFGLNERGVNHHVGTNIGVIAGHAMGEPVTQLTMRTFHTGGAGDSGGVVDAFARVNQLLKVPDRLPNASTLATVSGVVDVVRKDPRGGYTVFIRPTAGERAVEHRIVTGKHLPAVQKGVAVQRGQQLSSGVIDPRQLLQHTRSMPKVRTYLTDEIYNAYDGMVRRRNIETVVKAMTNLTHVNHGPDDSGMIRGQMVSLSEVDAYNAEARADGREMVRHTPQLKSMTQVPLAGNEDWMARLNYQRLKETYQEGAAQGWSSDIHGHPIPGLAHGAEFGLQPQAQRGHK